MITLHCSAMYAPMRSLSVIAGFAFMIRPYSLGLRFSRDEANARRPSGRPARRAGRRRRSGRRAGPATRARPRPARGSARPRASIVRRVPAEHRRDQLGGLRRGGDAAVEGLDRDPGAPGQHVVEVQGALVGGRVDDLGPQVVVGALQRLAQRRVARRPASSSSCSSDAVAVEQVLDPRDVQAGSRGQPAPARSTARW